MISLMSCPDIFIHLLDKFEYQSTLGEGSFGMVYLVKNKVNRQEYALKLLKLNDIPILHQENIKKRFEMEFLTGKINSPYLVSTHEIDYVNGIPFFTMDYCPNSNLERKIHLGLNDMDIPQIGIDIISGLNVLHQNGKIHRDLKPENILFDKNMRPRLSDFGICGHLNHSLTKATLDNRPSQIFGSYAYMAPEQLNPKNQNVTALPASDIFSLGVVLYELFMGRLPFGKWDDISDIQPYLDRASKGDFDPMPSTIPNHWQNLISTCLQSDLNKRYSNMAEVMAAIGMIDLGIAIQINQFAEASILEMQGENHGKIYSLRSKNHFLLGRYTTYHNNDLAITETLNSYVSSKQATIERFENDFYIRDGQWSSETNVWYYPKNGTYLNGKKIEKNESKLLRHNDIIIVGNTTLKFLSDSSTKINN